MDFIKEDSNILLRSLKIETEILCSPYWTRSATKG